jgi:geranylgeranyl diphosphate synthase type II
MTFDFNAYITMLKEKVDSALDAYFPQSGEIFQRLNDAMRYSLFAGGKRLRPILCIAGAEAVGGDKTTVMPIACALELIHTYSLIHDDLPCMDNDDLRRGKPTNHIAFDEATAILSGDSLLTEAFNLLSLDMDIDSSKQLQIIRIIANAAGARGMVGGQMADIVSEGKAGDIKTLEFIHRHKTACLLSASVEAGGVACRGNREQISALRKYGNNIGLAFQAMDDILDVIGDVKKLSKEPGVDQQSGKLTYPSLIGLEHTKKMIQTLINTAKKDISPLGDNARLLISLADYIITRDN